MAPQEVPLRNLFLLTAIVLSSLAGCDDDSSNNNGNNTNNTNNSNNTNAPVCGNNLKEQGEECDDGNFINGDGCSNACVLEYECGDGIVEFNEVCDSTDLQGSTCVLHGFTGGTLSCNETCRFDTSECTSEVETDMTGWYKLDGNSSQEYNSAPPHDNLCVVNEFTTGALIREMPGVVGESIYFDGTVDMRGYLDCGPGYYAYDEITVEGWIQTSAFPMDVSFIMSSMATYDATGLSFYMGMTSDFKFEVGVNDWDDVAHTTAFITTGEWVHLAFTYDGSSLNLYVNGELDSEKVHEYGPLNTLTTDNSRVFFSNNFLDGGQAEQGHYFTGYMDEMKVWSTVRTQTQICSDAGGIPNEETSSCAITLPEDK
ncbi:hypothetical protein KKF34_01965 [Myxococcota bacterium]|nr:hypothetical protein [Myxococcota bacterium]MBU1381204.1 hypothetical protein [Myxococcota bacterium]MBU1495626.1 hypothetical protein [Myxococcota bacterium]